MEKLVLLILCFVSAVVAGGSDSPIPFSCPNGESPGPYCQSARTCHKGDLCINRRCCPSVTKHCKSNVIGPVCSDYRPCKDGYSCIKKRCCRDPVCPNGWKEGPSCNTLPDQQRCPFRYECRQNGFCCQRPSPPNACPRNQSPGPVCSDYQPCKKGYSCINGYCCRDPVCPRGWTEGQSCNTFPGQQRCPFRYECRNNGFCCRRPSPPPGGCPMMPMVVPWWCQFRRPGAPQCTDTSCPRGTICCPDQCGWRTCMTPNPPRKG